MDNRLVDYLNSIDIESRTVKDDNENSVIYYDIDTKSGRTARVAHIVSRDGKNISTVVSGLSRTIPFYKKNEVWEFINDKNIEENKIKFLLTEENKIAFSIDRVIQTGSEIEPSAIVDDYKKILRRVDEYTLVNYIEENYSKSLDINEIIRNSSDHIAEDMVQDIKDYLNSKDIFVSRVEEGNNIKLIFKIVNSAANAYEVEYKIYKNSKDQFIEFRNIFGNQKEVSKLYMLEVAWNLNVRYGNIKYIYTEETNSFNVRLHYHIEPEKLNPEELLKDIIVHSDLFEIEYKNFLQYLQSQVIDLFIETPDNDNSL